MFALCKLSKPVRKASAGILKTICGENTFNFSNKLFTRDNHSVLSSSFCSLDRNYVHSLGCKNVKCSTSIFTRAHCLIKSQVRYYSENRAAGLPHLTSGNLLLDILHEVPFSNLLLSYFVIRPFIDSTFDLREFVIASKQVVQVVSRKLATNDIESLEEIMTTQAFNEMKQNLSKFSVDQRRELAIDPEDIYFSSPAVNGMIFRNDRETNKKSLQITMVHHVYRGLKDDIKKEEDFNLFENMQDPQDPQQQQEFIVDENKVYVLNYKFIREYGRSNMASNWLLCGINHYRRSQIEQDFISEDPC